MNSSQKCTYSEWIYKMNSTQKYVTNINYWKQTDRQIELKLKKYFIVEVKVRIWNLNKYSCTDISKTIDCK